jgi:hypothetical protein
LSRFPVSALQHLLVFLTQLHLHADSPLLRG